MPKSKIGKIGKKYCKHESYGGKTSYDCVAWRDIISDEQAKELGLNKKESGWKYRPKSELIDPDACDREWYDHSKNHCERGKEYAAYHGTSQEHAADILDEGFKMYTAYLGRGAYFAGRDDPPYVYGISTKSALKYAKENERGVVIASCIPFKAVTTWKDAYKRDKSGNVIDPPEWYQEFNKLRSGSPESIELWFSWHGHEYDTMDEVRNAWNMQGENIRKLALEHGIRAWADQDSVSFGQTVVYDPKLLKDLRLYELESCRTAPKIERSES